MSAASCGDTVNVNDCVMSSRERKPSKGILKNSSSFDIADAHPRKEMKWDEMNIIATHHPPDKDYGHMKVDEPPTPYSRSLILDEEDSEASPACPTTSKVRSGSLDHTHHHHLDPTALASRLEGHQPRAVMGDQSSSEEEDEDEHKPRNDEFESKRRTHYNEFQAMKLAKQLMEHDDEEEEEFEDETSTTVTTAVSETSTQITEKIKHDRSHRPHSDDKNNSYLDVSNDVTMTSSSASPVPSTLRVDNDDALGATQEDHVTKD